MLILPSELCDCTVSTTVMCFRTITLHCLLLLCASLQDLCQLVNADAPYWLVGMTEMTRTFGLELLESVLNDFPGVFLEVQATIYDNCLLDYVLTDGKTQKRQLMSTSCMFYIIQTLYSPVRSNKYSVLLCLS